jgi:hypothetical protein
MRIALQDLALTKLFVVHPGSSSYPLDEHIDAVSLRTLPERLATL